MNCFAISPSSLSSTEQELQFATQIRVDQDDYTSLRSIFRCKPVNDFSPTSIGPVTSVRSVLSADSLYKHFASPSQNSFESDLDVINLHRSESALFSQPGKTDDSTLLVQKIASSLLETMMSGYEVPIRWTMTEAKVLFFLLHHLFFCFGGVVDSAGAQFIVLGIHDSHYKKKRIDSKINS